MRKRSLKAPPKGEKKSGTRRRKMNSTRTVPVTPALIAEALEHYWRSIAMIKPNEEVKINIDLNGTLEAEVKTTKEVVEVFRL
jgi:hypothetical protein